MGNPKKTLHSVQSQERVNPPAFSINSISGVPSHGNIVTLNMSQAGTKPTAAPVLWDTVDNQSYSLSDGDSIPVGGGNPFGENLSSRVKYDSVGGNQRHPRSIAQYKAIAQAGATLGGVEWAKTNQTYMAWWFKAYTDFLTAQNHSSKFLRLSDSTDLIGRTMSWTQKHTIIYWPEEIVTNPGVPFADHKLSVWDSVPTGLTGNWNFFEAFLDNTTRRIVLKVNNTTVTDAIWQGTLVPLQFNKLWKLGWDSGSTEPLPLSWSMSDIYIDNTLTKVILGDAPTYSACKFFEIQPPSAWADSTILVTFNQGAFNSGDTAYLYTMDAAGTVTPSYAVSIP